MYLVKLRESGLDTDCCYIPLSAGVDLFASHGCNLDSLSENGLTAMMVAVMKGKVRKMLS